MAVYSSEITSSEIQSDNPIHQRLFFGYYLSEKYVKGKVLEIGCGTGRGLEILLNSSDHYTGIDKNTGLIEEHSQKYPDSVFIDEHIPPLSKIETSSMDR